MRWIDRQGRFAGQATDIGDAIRARHNLGRRYLPGMVLQFDKKSARRLGRISKHQTVSLQSVDAQHR